MPGKLQKPQKPGVGLPEIMQSASNWEDAIKDVDGVRVFRAVISKAALSVLAAIVATAAMLPLASCQPLSEPSKPQAAAIEVADDSLRTATSYAEILSNIRSGLDAALLSFEVEQAGLMGMIPGLDVSAEARGAGGAADADGVGADGAAGEGGGAEGIVADSAAAADAAAADDAAAPSDADALLDPAHREAIELSKHLNTGVATINPLISTAEQGLANTNSPTLFDERGYLYTVDGGLLRAFSFNGREAVSLLGSIAVYSDEGGSSQVQSLALAGTTLAVQCAVPVRERDYGSPDYALAAYAAPKTTLLFYDVSNPSNPVYLRTLGVTGTSENAFIRGGYLYIAATHATLPAAADGRWDLAGSDGEPKNTVAAIYKGLDLRQDEPLSYVPSFIDDNSLIALDPAQIYIPAETDYATATVFACFDIANISCVSLFAIYDPGTVTETVSHVWGEQGLYLIWQRYSFDAASEKATYISHLAQVALDKGQTTGIANFQILPGRLLYPAFLSERNGRLTGAVQNIGEDYAIDWSFVSFDASLKPVAELSDINGGAQLGSFCIIGDRAYLATTDAAQPFGILNIENPDNPKLLVRSNFADWPQKLAALSDGSLLGYGNEGLREQMNRALSDPAQPAPALNDFGHIALYNVDGVRAYSIGERLTIPELPGFIFRQSTWTHPVQVFEGFGLVAVPLLTIDDASSTRVIGGYAFYRFDGQGISPVATIDLVGYRNVVVYYDANSVYLFCYPPNGNLELLPELLTLDANTLQQTARIAI
jgi:hypothetical protein